MIKKLGYWGALSLVVGNIIGVGIFTTSGFMAQYIPSPQGILFAWFLGALYALSGAIVYGILAKAYPLSGGDYQYLSKAFHPLLGYLFGWSCFFITYSGSIAALSIGAAYYLNGIIAVIDLEAIVLTSSNLELNISMIKIVAIMVILLFTYLNYRGIVISGKYQIFLTTTIVVFIICFSLLGTISIVPNMNHFWASSQLGQGNISDFLVALIAVLFAYMGWTAAVYVSEEIHNASHTIPMVLITGVLLVGFLYLWINLVFILTVPIEEMKNVVNIGTLVSTYLWGDHGKAIISGFIFVAILGSINSTILSGPRIYWAMGRDSHFYGITKKLHDRYNTPARALLLQAIWSVLLVITGSFNQLLSFVVFVAIIFSILAGLISLKVLTMQPTGRAWKTVIVLFYQLFCFIILINTLWQRPKESIIGVFLLAVALPFYYLENKRNSKRKDKISIMSN
jgi:APA family basic amino acid/polyamine antiporter